MARALNESLWHHLSDELTTEMRDWRLQHPKATLREIETELDARLAHARARMLEDLAMGSSAASWTEAAHLQSPTCPQCGALLDERGAQSRTLLTEGGQHLTFERSYGVCPACQSGLFPP